MDPFLQFLTWQFVLFCMFVVAITQVIRNVVEFSFKDSKTTNVWTKLILPTTPILIGAILGFFLKGPYPDGISVRDSQIVFGTVAGMFSTILYRVLKNMLKARLSDPEEAEEDLLTSVRGSINPAPDTTTITTTTTTSVPVIDGQPVISIPTPVAVVPAVDAPQTSVDIIENKS